MMMELIRKGALTNIELAYRQGKEDNCNKILDMCGNKCRNCPFSMYENDYFQGCKINNLKGENDARRSDG